MFFVDYFSSNDCVLISRNVDIHICFSTLSTKCKIVDDTRQKKKAKGNEGNTSELEDPLCIHPTYAGTWEHNYAQKDIISTTKEPLLVLDGRLIIDNNIRHHSQLNSDYISIFYIPRLLKKQIYKNTLVLVNTYYENCPYRGKSGKDEKRGNYLSITHGYGFHGGPNVRGNVV